MSLDSEVELVRRFPIFAKIDLAMLKLLCFSSERLTFEAGQVMFNAGDPGDAAYILFEGSVDVSKATPTGPLVVGTLGRMEIVGEIAIFADVPRTATVTATARVDALRIAKEQFMSIIRANPDAALELIRILALRVASTTARLTESLSDKRA
jgi:CRP/FNR family cyclic AMP-dependent transcriptional regulator